MDAENKNLVILAYQYSVVVRGIENRLRGQGYEVEAISEDLEVVKSRINKAALFITYLPDDIMEDVIKLATFSEIVDLLSAEDKKMIILGEAKYHDDLLVKVPGMKAFEWVNRPVDMDKFGQMVKDTLSGKKVASGPKRILIVDDDPSYAKMVREWIKDAYRVDIVTAGMQAISFLIKVQETKPIDLILLDYEMPVVDGPQVLQMLRQEPLTAKIPIIFLTGNGTKEAVSRVMELKPDGYILKSTSRESILEYLRKKIG